MSASWYVKGTSPARTGMGMSGNLAACFPTDVFETSSQSVMEGLAPAIFPPSESGETFSMLAIILNKTLKFGNFIPKFGRAID